MYCRIPAIWEIPSADDPHTCAYVLDIEWSQSDEPFVPLVSEAIRCEPDFDVAVWLAQRNRQLERQAAPDQLHPALAEAIGQVRDVQELIDAIAPEGIDLDAIARQEAELAHAAAHAHGHVHSHG